MSKKITTLFEPCNSCGGRGWWPVTWIKKDGTEAKRMKRYPCARCGGTGNARPKPEQSQKPNDDIPF